MQPSAPGTSRQAIATMVTVWKVQNGAKLLPTAAAKINSSGCAKVKQVTSNECVIIGYKLICCNCIVLIREAYHI